MNSQVLEPALSQRPRSTLFARMASEHLSAGHIEHAKELCLSGVERFPRYATGRLVLAKCFAAEEDFSAAVEELRSVVELVPDSIVVRDLLARWSVLALRAPKPKVEISESDKVSPGHPERSEVTLVSSGVDPSLHSVPLRMTDEAVLEKESKSVPAPEPVQLAIPVAQEPAIQPRVLPQVPIVQEPAPSPPVIQETIQAPSPAVVEPPREIVKPPDVIAPATAVTTVLGGETKQSPPKKFQPEIRPSDVLDQESGRIVTKTLAEIYAMQSAYGEAILTYKLLRRKRPEQAGEIDRRIQELEARRQTK